MKKLSLIIAAVLVLGVASISKAQDDSDVATHNVSINVPEIALLDIEGNKDITFALNGIVNEAGNNIDLTSATNNELWLNYTVLTGSKGKSGSKEQKISVSLDKEIPGINLMLKVGADKGNGAGAKGTLSTSSAFAVKDNTSTEIIKGIGSCYTGNGTENGHNLAYSLEVDKFEEIVAGEHSVTVTYTFTDK